MKAAHMPKIEARRKRAIELLVPEEVARGGEIPDPEKRLAELIKRIDGQSDPQVSAIRPGYPVKQGVDDLMTLLFKDLPEMIEAVRDANREAAEARAALAGRAGTTYTVTITSDSPMRVATMEADFAQEGS
jgi:hypothetical protein